MKKQYILIAISMIGIVCHSQTVTIPDANFKAKLIQLGVDTNYDGSIQQSEALTKTNLNLDYSNISDLTGINAFTNLNQLSFVNNSVSSLLPLNGLSNITWLNLNNNQVTSLEGLSVMSNVTLLDCSNNPLTSLNGISSFTNLQYLDCNNIPLYNLSSISNMTQLIYIGCENCQLTTLADITGLPNLHHLWCGLNSSTILSDINGMSSITQLSCRSMFLTNLNSILGLSNLTLLDVGDNYISSINLSAFPNLTEFFCYNNNLSSLNLSQAPNLTRLNCSNNHLTTLNISPLINLGELVCYSNQLTSINLTGLNLLNVIDCSNNHITSLNLTNLNQLHNLYCSYNYLTTLDVSNQHDINELECTDMNSLQTLFLKNGSFYYSLNIFNNPNLKYICADDNLVPDIQNMISMFGYTNCHVNSYCSFSPGGTFYTIQGNNRFDLNNNGCDTGDANVPNLKLSFSDNGTNANLFPDATGSYHYDVQASTQTVIPTLENPNYFNITPTTITVSFPQTTSPFTQDFCLSPNGAHNDLEIMLIPVSVARPGFNTQYKIIYKNKGTTIQNGTINLSFNDAVLDFISANPAITNQTTNSLNWNFSNLLPFESKEILLTLNLNSPVEIPPTNAGDVLNFSTSVVGAADETAIDNSSNINQIVVNSLDPNDKTCIEGTTITPSMVGNYVHYIIRFENDGNYNAQNIVIKDIIDTNKFDISTLVPLSGSASYETRLTNNNQIEFIFENINLPFITGTNTGYIAFKIKTKPSLVIGNTFSNSASIFFDYNYPIVTNTATTTVQLLGVNDFDFDTYFTIYPNPVDQVLNLNVKAAIKVNSIGVFDVLGQQVIAIPNADSVSKIDVTNLKTGSYFIKMITDKGTTNFKFLKA